MVETWKQWEGSEVNGEFPLREYLGGSDHSAVFLTQRGEREPQKAAIKLVPAKLEDPELQLSWWGLAAKLSHPNLLRLFQMGRCRLGSVELLYLVMEYAEEDLSQILPLRSLTSGEARQMLKPVLDVLAYLHGKGFVHGHIKPTNIMAVGDQLKVSTDGLCGVGELSGVLGVSSLYTPPEIASGAGISPSADVWSLGVTLVEALTQHPPIWQDQQQDPVVPETLPSPFLDIARHCVRCSPQLRWTVAQIGEHLQLASTGSGKAPPMARLTAPRDHWRYWAAAAAGLALLALLAGPRILNRRQAAERPSSIPSELSAAQPTPEPRAAAPGTKASPETATDKRRRAKPTATSPASSTTTAATISTGGAVPGIATQQVMPDVSRNARATIQGRIRVRVKVKVNSSGSVAGAKLVARGPSRYFANKALQAAQNWKFTPPQVDEQPVASEWILRFEFTRSGTTVHPAQITP